MIQMLRIWKVRLLVLAKYAVIGMANRLRYEQQTPAAVVTIGPSTRADNTGTLSNSPLKITLK